MRLSITYPDDRVEEIYVLRVFTFNSINAGPCLYYETSSDIHGKGKTIHLSDIKCWEVNAVIRGSSMPL